MSTRTLEGEILDPEAFMGTAVARDDRGIRDQRVVNAREWHQVGLEFIQVHIKGTIEPKTGSDRANNLGNQAVKMFVARAGNIQVAAANIVNSFVVHQESAVGVLNGTVGG